MNKETNDNSNTYRRIYRPKPILSGIEEIRQDFEEELVTGTIKYGLEILDDAVGTVRKGSMTFIIAAPNCLDYDTRVLTVDGFKSMKDITIQDKVITPDGKVSDIEHITETEEIDCYELETTDGRKIIGSYNHLFPTYHYGSLDHKGTRRGYIYRLMTMEDISKAMDKSWRKEKLFLENCNLKHIEPKKLPVPPYVLGVLIGDGCLTCSGLRYTKPSLDVFTKVQYFLPGAKVFFSNNKKDVCINDGGNIKKYICDIGLNVHSYEKFIPNEYKHGLSVEQRLELLQGLLDTDGHQTSSYNEFSTTSERLAYDVQQLAWSLGYRCTIKSRMGKYKKNGKYITTRVNYRVVISNHRTKAQCVIKSCKRVDSRKTKCITINDNSHKFIVNDYLVTCNTGKSLLGLQIGVEFAKQNKRVLICSCEMGAGLLMEREIRKEAGISRNELRDLYESRRDIANKIMDSMIEQSQYEYMTRIDICETAGATVEDIIGCIQCGSQDGKPYDAVIVDYIQRIAGIGEEYRVITNAARQLQNLARDTGLYLICCSQAGRQSIDEAKFGAKGAVDGSRIKGKGSGSIEEDADVGITLMELFEQGQKYILITLFKNRYGNLKNISYKYRMDDRLRLTLVTKDGG